jgi:acyl carrier protein
MDEAGVAELVRHAIVDALALDLAPESLRGEQPLFEPPIRMDSLGFHRVVVEIEVRREARLDEHALDRTLFETLDDLIRFVVEQSS